MSLTIDDLAARPRWSDDQTRALAGSVRGDTLGAWGQNLVARFGPDALARVRARVPADVAALAPVLGERDRAPVYAQLLLTEAIVDECLGGDVRALYPLLLADTRAGFGRVQLVVLRAMRAAGALRLGPTTFRKIHERGTHEVEVDGRHAHLVFRDNPLFAHPTWRVLQVFATQVLLELVKTPGTVTGADAGATAFAADVRW